MGVNRNCLVNPIRSFIIRIRVRSARERVETRDLRIERLREQKLLSSDRNYYESISFRSPKREFSSSTASDLEIFDTTTIRTNGCWIITERVANIFRRNLNVPIATFEPRKVSRRCDVNYDQPIKILYARLIFKDTYAVFTFFRLRIIETAVSVTQNDYVCCFKCSNLQFVTVFYNYCRRNERISD